MSEGRQGQRSEPLDQRPGRGGAGRRGAARGGAATPTLKQHGNPSNLRRHKLQHSALKASFLPISRDGIRKLCLLKRYILRSYTVSEN